MKVVNQSYELLTHPNGDNTKEVLKLIEKIGRVCYRSESLITENSYKKFVESIKNRKHWAVLEHFTLNMYIPHKTYENIKKFRDDLSNDPVVVNCFKFIYFNEVNGKYLLSLSATTVNYLWNHIGNKCDESIINLFIFIASKFPEMIKIPVEINTNISLPDDIEFMNPDDLEDDNLKLIHKFISVKFTTSRSIANQIVRHRTASFAQESMRYNNYMKDKFDNQITIIKNKYFINQEDLMDQLGEWAIANEYAEIAYSELIKYGTPPEVARDILPHDTKTELVMTANLFEWRHFLKLRTDYHSHPQIVELSLPLLYELYGIYPSIFKNINGFTTHEI